MATSLGSPNERFAPGLRVDLGKPEGPEPGRAAVIERSWLNNGELVLKFEGLDTRNDAEELRGLAVRVPLRERPGPPDGMWYLSDLVGCTVETVDGRTLGEVEAVEDYGAAPLLVIGKLLIPFTEAVYREIEIEVRRIVVELPEGLEDLNR